MKAESPIEYKTLYESIHENAVHFPERISLDFLDRPTTYKDLLQKVDAAAAAFLRHGFTQGDRVALCLPNCPQAVISIYALNRIGATTVMLNPLSPPLELRRQLEESCCKGLVILDIFLFKIVHTIPERFVKNKGSNDDNKSIKLKLIVHASLAEEMPVAYSLKYFVAAFPRLIKASISKYGTQSISWRIFLHRNSTLPPIPPCQIDPDAEAIIIFSGGTSGNPKPVVHSSASINAAAVQCLATEPSIEEGMSMLTVLPFFHIFGLNVSVHLALIAAGTCILVPRFSADITAKMIIRKQPTYMAGVPTMYEALLKSHLLRKAEEAGKLDFSKFRLGFCGGDQISDASLQKINQLIMNNKGNGKIVQGYGLTESCPVTVMPRNGTGPKGSVGRAFPGVQICITKPGTFEELPFEEEGEICVSALSTMICYLNDQKETHRTLFLHRDGKMWLHTGDVGRMDHLEYLYLHNRLRKIIKVSGNTVYTATVEAVLLSHSGIHSVCVVGIPDEYQIQRLAAYIVLSHGYEQNKIRRELVDFCQQRLSPWSVPTIWEFRKTLPVNLIGKVAWGKLEEEIKA